MYFDCKNGLPSKGLQRKHLEAGICVSTWNSKAVSGWPLISPGYTSATIFLNLFTTQGPDTYNRADLSKLKVTYL